MPALQRHATSRLALLAVLCLGAVPANAGAPAVGHTLGYRLGLGADQARDELLVPGRWAGPQVDVAVGWGYVAESWELGVGMGFATSYLDKGDGQGGVLLLPHLGAEALFEVFAAEGVRVYLGPAWRSGIDNAFLYSWDDVRTYYLSTHMLRLAARLDWRLADAPELSAALRLPVAGLVSRPPDIRLNKQDDAISFDNLFGAPNADPGWATWPDYAGLELALGATWRDDDGAGGVSLEYVLEYRTYSAPRPVQRLTNSVVFTHRFGIGGQ